MNLLCSTCGKLDHSSLPEGNGDEHMGPQPPHPPPPPPPHSLVFPPVGDGDGDSPSRAPPRPFESAPAESPTDSSSGSRPQQHTDRFSAVLDLDTTIRVDLGCPPAHADRLGVPLALGVFEDSSSDGKAGPDAEPDYFAHGSFTDDARETQLLLRVDGGVKGEEYRSIGDKGSRTPIPAPTVDDPLRHGVTQDEDELERDMDVRAKRRLGLLLLLAMLASCLIVVLQGVLLWQVYGSVCTVCCSSPELTSLTRVSFLCPHSRRSSPSSS